MAHNNTIQSFDAYGRPVAERDSAELAEVYRLLLDAAMAEDARLRAENETLRAFCIRQILSRRGGTQERNE